MNDYLRFIKTSLKAAEYHEDQAFLFKGLQPNDYNKIVYHLRAYFWELYSVWDYVFQYVNSLTLKLDPYDVRRNFLARVKKTMPAYKFLPLLESFQNNERLNRIMWLRDHAHKWQINPYLVDHDDEEIKVIALDNLDLKDKNLPKQINIDRNDLWFAKELVGSLFKKGFFKQ